MKELDSFKEKLNDKDFVITAENRGYKFEIGNASKTELYFTKDKITLELYPESDLFRFRFIIDDESEIVSHEFKSFFNDNFFTAREDSFLEKIKTYTDLNDCSDINKKYRELLDTYIKILKSDLEKMKGEWYEEYYSSSYDELIYECETFLDNINEVNIPFINSYKLYISLKSDSENYLTNEIVLSKGMVVLRINLISMNLNIIKEIYSDFIKSVDIISELDLTSLEKDEIDELQRYVNLSNKRRESKK